MKKKHRIADLEEMVAELEARVERLERPIISSPSIWMNPPYDDITLTGVTTTDPLPADTVVWYIASEPDVTAPWSPWTKMPESTPDLMGVSPQEPC